MSSQTRPSLAGRALLAIVLMIGFYVLALAMIAALILVPAMLGTALPLKLTLLCWLAAAVVVWSILPRIDRFKAPGPRLDEREQPRLFREIEALARATDQPVPQDVYLIADVNAFVARRGGFMGFFSRPVMGIGLPLAATMSSAELRSVLAHEFGHFHGGDTHLGPWIYKTRAAVVRTVGSLDRTENVLLQLINAPFRGYRSMFLRVTQAISRQQELGADALAARIVGAGPTASALGKLDDTALAYRSFLIAEYSPLIESGFRAPLADGFARFAAATTARSSREDRGEKPQMPADPFDSHPPTHERLAALPADSKPSQPGDDVPALGWFDGLTELESQLLATMLVDKDVDKLAPLTWNETVTRVWIPHWRKRREHHARLLAGKTVADLADCARRAVELGNAVIGQPIREDEAANIGVELVGSAFMLALIDHGWRADNQPGCQFTATQDGRAFEPFAAVRELATGALSDEAWRARAAELGLADSAVARATLDGAPVGR